MHRRFDRLLAGLFVLALCQVAARCPFDFRPRGIEIVEPSEANVTACLDSVAFVIRGPIRPETLEVLLNGEPLQATRNRQHYRAPIDRQLQTDNLLEVRGNRPWDAEPMVTTHAFSFTPPTRAFQISDPDDLITGPLAHGRVGDWMLANCTARFIVQDVAKRDLYSVGQYGGNIIDLELISRPGLDNFIEIQPTLDVETVINAQTIEIVNDGVNDEPASIRTCGPDDLLDFINPSSQISGIPGVAIPVHADDIDLPIEACTLYTLAAFESRVRMDTTVTNFGPIGFPLLVGDWINAGGELESLFTPGDGPGSGLTANLGAISWFGRGEAAGVDYSFAPVPLPGAAGQLVPSFLNTSGVTLSLQPLGVLAAILGTQSPFAVLPGESRTYTRYLGVGDGSPSNAIDLAADVSGDPTARVAGCVTVGGEPAAGARVAIGTLDAGEIASLHSLFTTDSQGCYAGNLPPTPQADQYAMAASLAAHLYEGGAPDPPLHPFTVSAGETLALPAVDLPVAGRVEVSVFGGGEGPIPARVTVVGFDPSPEPIIEGGSLFGLNVGDVGLFQDPSDSRPFGISTAHYATASGFVSFPLEPGSYEIYVSRGTEYSLYHERVTIVGGEMTPIDARIQRVIETPGFVSSDFHVHGIHSADSGVSHTDRVMQFAGEGVENVVMTDHHVHTDLNPRIAALGFEQFVHSTIGEEITSFDYGHFNGYPFTIDPSRPSGGSTDWAGAAPPGMDFPQYGAYNATPSELYALATTSAQALASTVVQVNHIGSYFSPLKIDTGIGPISDALTEAERTEHRLPATGNLFHAFDGLELWNGESRGAQRNFLEERIGIWFNHLNEGIPITFIADTDTHKFFNLNSAGARTWTASSTDAPDGIDPDEVGAAVAAGRAVGGQGVYVQARLVSGDGSGAVADLTRDGQTLVASTNGNIDLEIRVQAPVWASYDTIEIYANAATVPDLDDPYEYSALPDMTLTAGVDFVVNTVALGYAPGTARFETELSLPFTALAEDTWFVVLVKGSDGVSAPMFPVFAENLAELTNTNLEELTDGNLGEQGVMALGVTNALYADVDGEPGFQTGL
jgi:hypothetical protein